MLRRLLAAALRRTPFGRRPTPELGEDARLYTPRFSPWLDPRGFGRLYQRIKEHTVVDACRCHILHTLARQARHVPGEYWECGVYRGGTARLLADVAAETGRPLRLFDTFCGMPPAEGGIDWHEAGDFADTSLAAVRAVVAYAGAHFHEGLIPESFTGLEAGQIALAHVDVDLYRSVWDCCCFIYPSLTPGGFLVFDDYGWPTCLGARKAVDSFFSDKPERPLVLPTGQAIVVRLPHEGTATQGPDDRERRL
jgi:O-methyltransferase